MPVSLLVAFGALVLLGSAAFAVAWIASTPLGDEQKSNQLELSLKRIEREVHAAQELVGAGR